MKIIEIQHHSRAHGVVVSHPLSMREALGSIPSESRLRTAATLAVLFLGPVVVGECAVSEVCKITRADVEG